MGIAFSEGSLPEGCDFSQSWSTPNHTGDANLRNVIWIAENHYLSLKNVEPQTSIFFEKADDNEFLQLLLSKKAILVEGATEYLLLPKFYEKKTGRTVENDGISIISCNGISYKRYLEIAEETGKRIAIITDNDHEQTKIDDANEFNQHNEKQHVFMGAIKYIIQTVKIFVKPYFEKSPTVF